jgi:glyoxylase-like metal-dependent hydrolase (beta-lactamase superfamily II)
VRVDAVTTAGVFILDGQSFDVENNVWLVGDDAEVLVIDSAHDAGAILGGVAGRRVTGIVCTHGHNDHIGAAVELAERTGAPIWLHPDDRMLWDAVHGSRAPDAELADGSTTLQPSTAAACSSPATPCSRAVPAPLAAPTRTSTPSSCRSASGC